MAEQQLGMTVQVLTPKEYIFLSSALYTQFQRQELSREDYLALLQAFVGLDLYNSPWIFEPQSGEWVQVAGDTEPATEPRGPLTLFLPVSAVSTVKGITDWLQEISASLPSAQSPAMEAAPVPAVPRPPLAGPVKPPPPAASPAPAAPPVSRFCTACGSQLKLNAAFCSRCGKPVVAETR